MDSEPLIPSLVTEMAAARARGAAWRQIHREYIEAQRLVRDMGIGGPERRGRPKKVHTFSPVECIPNMETRKQESA